MARALRRTSGNCSARSLAGLVSERGLIKISGDTWRDEAGAERTVRDFLEKSTAIREFSDAITAEDYAGIAGWFKRQGMPTFESWARKGERFFSRHAGPIEQPCPVTMVGVWDTVGSLGVPVGVFDKASESLFEFRDCRLSPNVGYGYHAVALDELREAFQPTLWEPRSNVKQVWFCGAHADVGGGYAASGLSDYALRWMLAKARKHGVEFGDEPAFTPDPLQEPSDSYSKLFGERVPRVVPERSALHESVAEKLRRVSGYRPAALMRHGANGEPSELYEIVTDSSE